MSENSLPPAGGKWHGEAVTEEVSRTRLMCIPIMRVGILPPLAVYHFTVKQPIVERLREAET